MLSSTLQVSMPCRLSVVATSAGTEGTRVSFFEDMLHPRHLTALKY